MTKLVSRRDVLAGGAGLAALPLVGAPALAQSPRFDGVTLRIATFGGGWEKALHDFIGIELEKRGGKDEYLPSPPRESLAKLIAARGREAPFDVLEMADNTWVDTFEGGFLQKINLANIPNKKELEPHQYDENKVASWNTQEGLLYNIDKFKENGIPVPERYSDLTHPKLAGRISMIDISQAGSTQFLVGASLDAGGSETNLEPGLKLLKQLKIHKFWKLGAEALTQMQAGDSWVAAMHAGFAVQTRRNGLNYGFVHPKVGAKRGMLKEGWLGIVKGSKNAAAAEFFFNAYIDAEAQEKLALRRGIVPVNPNARANLGKDPILKSVFLLAREDVNNMVRVDFTKLDLAAMNDKWTRAVAN
jgi:putative spermidine/putrescine transport system substrate-binding protein